MTQRVRSTLLVAFAGILAACSPGGGSTSSRPIPSSDATVVAQWVPEVVRRLAHDTTAWTQGLVVDGEHVYESTGRYGESALRELDRSSGNLLRERPLDDALYGEGLTLVDDRLLQLTWREETLVVWEGATLMEVDRIGYEGEGWGICLDDDRLVMSDGSDELALRDPATFAVIGTVAVTIAGMPISGLNELECVDGLVLANVWPTTDIVVIDPDDGVVVASIDASSLDAEVAAEGGRDVLNGIAYDPRTETFLLTGKLWPTMFEVRFVER